MGNRNREIGSRKIGFLADTDFVSETNRFTKIAYYRFRYTVVLDIYRFRNTDFLVEPSRKIGIAVRRIGYAITDDFRFNRRSGHYVKEPRARGRRCMVGARDLFLAEDPKRPCF